MAEEELLLEGTESKDVSTKDRIWPYLVVTSSFISLALAGGFNLGIAGSLTVALSQRFSITIDQASLSISTHIIFYQLTNPLCMMLTRKISTRQTQFIGFVVSVIGVGACSFATEHWHVMLLFGLTAGTGMSFIKATLIAVLPYHFEGQRLHMATAVAVAGFSAGYVLVTPLASFLFNKYGFSTTMIMQTPLMLVHLLGVVFFSQGSKMVSKQNISASQSIRESVREILGSATVWALLWATFLRRVGDAGYFTIDQDYAMHDLGLSLPETGEAGAIYGALSWFGTVLVIISHAWKLQYSMLVCHGVSALINGGLLLLVSAATSKASYYVLMGLFGLTIGVHTSNIINIGGELAGTSNLALVASFEIFFAGLGGLTGPPVASYLQVKRGYKYGIYACGGALVAGGILISFLAAYMLNQQQKQKSKICES